MSMTSDRNVSALFTLYSHTLTLTAGTGGSVSGGGNYGFGINATITATPSTGYSFGGWSGEGVTDTNAASTTVGMTTDRNVSALFTLHSHTLTLTAGSGGTVSGGGSYGYGTGASITATPDAGYSFTGWSGTGVSDTTSSNSTVSMTSDRNVSANFNLNTHTLSVNAGSGGSASGGGSYGYGTNATITATPDTGYSFSGWSGDNVADANATSTTVNIIGDQDVSANFSLNSHTLSLSAGAGGTVSGGGSYGYGTDATITATPNTGYSFSGWSGTGVSDANATNTTVSMTGDLVFQANFTLSNVELTFEDSLGGQLSGEGNYPKNSIVIVNAFPDEGYRFDQWIGEGVADLYSASTSVELNNSIKLKAQFSKIPFNTFNLNIVSHPVLGGTTTGSGNFEENVSIFVSAEPSDGYNFVNWSGDGFSDQNSSIYLTLNTDVNLTANFELKKYQLITSESIGGTILGSGFYEHGTTAQIIASPEEGYIFKEWIGLGITDLNSSSIFIKVENDNNFTALFERKKFEINASLSTGGTVTGAGNFEYGELVTVKAIPDSGYRFISWLGLEGMIGSEVSFVIESNKTIEAVFEKISLASFSSSRNLGSNWFEHWFGYFYENQNDWSYHSEFGWIYPSVQIDGSIWFWSENFSWLWVDEATRSKGLYWKEDEGSWIYFPDIHPSNQIFFHYNNQEWIKKSTSIDNG